MKARHALLAALFVCMLSAPALARRPLSSTTTLPHGLQHTTTTLVTPTTTLVVPDPTTTTVTLPPPPEPTTTTVPTAPPACVPGTSVGCEDGNPCTIDLCDGGFHCISVVADGAPCDDGDPCTRADRCRQTRCAGTPIDCGDQLDCTADRCDRGTCVHTPLDGRCDSGACRITACRPDDKAADARGCVVVGAPGGRDKPEKPPDDQPCTDDGFSCTDDVCGPAGCQHVPVDSRCVPPDACTSAVCAPERLDHDLAGCAPGPPRADDEECAEDGDACTLDVCRAGACAHDPVPDRATCVPVQGAFRQTIALDSLARGLMDATARTSGSGPLGSLGAVETALADASRALAGKDTPAPALAGGPGRPAVFVPTLSQQRAHIAFTMVLRTPRQVAAFLQAIALARSRATLGQPAAHDLRRRGRLLLRGTKTLKADLKRLQKVTATLAR